MYYFVGVRLFASTLICYIFLLAAGFFYTGKVNAQLSRQAADSIIDKYTQSFHSIAETGDWKRALSTGKECLAIAGIQLADPQKTAQLWFDIAYMSTENQQPDSAVHYYQLAKEEFEKNKESDPQQLGLLYNNLAFAMDLLGRQQTKIAYYTKALNSWKTCQPAPDGNIHTVLGNLVEAHTEYGSFKEAGRYLNELRERTGVINAEMRPLPNNYDFDSRFQTMLASVRYFGAVDSISAMEKSIVDIELVLNRISGKRKENYLQYLLSAYETVGYALKNRSQYDASRNYYEKVRARAKQPFYRMKGEANLAVLEYDQKNYLSSLQFTRRAIALIDTSWSGSSWFSLQVLETELYVRLGQEQKAEEGLVRLLSRMVKKPLDRQHFGNVSIRDFSGLSSYNFIQVLTKAAQVVKSLSASGRFRLEDSRNLFLVAADMFGEYYQQGVYNKNLDGLHRSIVEGLLGTQAALGQSSGSMEPVINRIENNSSRHVWKKFLYRYQQDFLPDQNQTPSEFKVAALQARLTPQQEILRYYVSDSTIYLLQVGAHKLQLTNLGRKDSILQLTQAFHESISSRRLNYSDPVASLSKCLLGPISESAKGVQHFIIIPDETLGFLPFEALLLEKGKPLAFSHAVSYSYSLSLWQIHQQLAATQGFKKEHQLAAFAPSYAASPAVSHAVTTRGTGLYHLEYASHEARHIAKLWNGVLFEDEAANKENFLRQIERFDLYHLAMHATLDSSSYELTNLVFSSGERLFFHELYKLHFPAEMVVLSACNTGIGAMEKGEGLMSLSHALSFAGVRSSVYSLWEVPDKETAEIIIRFYDLLAEGMDKAVALQMSKKEFLENNPYKQHPFYWAGFIINGSTGAIAAKDSGYGYRIIGMLGIALAGFGLWFGLFKRLK